MTIASSEQFCVSSAVPAIASCCLAICASTAVYAAPFANSQASNNESEWTGTSSGWVKQGTYYYYSDLRRPYFPTGNWGEDYKHWFGVAGEPANWSLYQNVRKPAKADWGTAAAVDDEHTTTSAGGSTATSYWYVKTDINKYYDNQGRYSFTAPGANLYTKSYANAKGGSNDQLANSRSRIIDPYIVNSPQTDPDWDPSQPLDPSGDWTFGGQVAIWGDVGANGDLDWSFSLAMDSISESSAVNLIDIDITGAKTTVTADSSLLSSGRLLFFAANGDALTLDDITADLDAYRTSSGWSLDPGFDISTFDPGDPSQTSKVFLLQWDVNMDPTVSTAAMFTNISSSASAIVPEPSTWLMLCVSLVGFFPMRRLRRAVPGWTA